MSLIISRLRRFLCGSEGPSAVEFALVAPILLVLVFGTIEFGLIFKDWLVITNGVREGARAGVVTAGDIDAKTAAVTEAVNNYTSALGTLDSLTVTCSDGVDCRSADSSLEVAATHTVTLVTPLGELIGWLGGGIGSELTISAGSEMRNE